MLDSPIIRLVIQHIRLTRLVAKYCCLRVQYVYLLIKYHLIKIGGAALIEAVKMQYFIKSWSKEERVVFAACIAVSIYCLALYWRIRI